MQYTYLKPESKNILKWTWNKASKSWIFWVPIILTLVLRFPVFIISVIYFMYMTSKARKTFWMDFASVNGWAYKEGNKMDIFDDTFTYRTNEGESSLLLNYGDKNIITNEIDGVIQGRLFRIFSYQYTIGSGKSSHTDYFTCFAFKTNGSFPHLYLNTKNNSWGVVSGEKISLSSEFGKKFELFAPRKYEIEALQIFTPDILARLLNEDFPYDVEFLNQEILIFAEGQINSFDTLGVCFNRSLVLQEIFFEKLNKFRFEKIGDMPHILK